MIAPLLGLTACLNIGATDALCDLLEAPVQSLSDALVANPETPEDVGVAGANVVITTQGGCGQ